MAGPFELGSSKKKPGDGVNDLLTFNAENMQSNMKIIYYSRTFLSIIGGVVAGILGFTSLKGFVFYFLLMMVTSLGLVAKARFSIHSYFDSSNRVLLDGFLGGLMVGFLFVYMRSGLCMADIFCLIKQESLLDNKGREVHKNRGQK
ncbi:hypothetical protein GLYMA_17G036700v4 [Glycine max]|nr:hypothetical protein GLYMA_17G036700v4 [Glycine max]KAH1116602.1 hypothetical protein GYH30_046148 [Glycine max]